jgi:DNA polymerase III epsilon subunit-like protein
VLLSYWKGKPNTTSNQEQLKRVTALQEEALKELRRPVQPLQRDAAPGGAARAGPAAGAAVGTGRPTAAEVPAACRDVYTRAHALLSHAACLVFDTETGGFVNPSVIDLGWILADADGEPLVSYERLWKLPAGERIDRRALKAHGITASRLEREGVLAKPEVGEFLALVAAALAAEVRVVAHNASFDVRCLNSTATKNGLAPSLRSASMLCTMHNATRHCKLRARGGRLKAPRNEELFRFLFGRKPAEQLHRALPDCRVTLASYIEGGRRKWW